MLNIIDDIHNAESDLHTAYGHYATYDHTTVYTNGSKRAIVNHYIPDTEYTENYVADARYQDLDDDGNVIRQTSQRYWNRADAYSIPKSIMQAA